MFLNNFFLLAVFSNETRMGRLGFSLSNFPILVILVILLSEIGVTKTRNGKGRKTERETEWN
jgi:hypothetical protein